MVIVPIQPVEHARGVDAVWEEASPALPGGVSRLCYLLGLGHGPGVDGGVSSDLQGDPELKGGQLLQAGLQLFDVEVLPLLELVGDLVYHLLGIVLQVRVEGHSY